MAEYILREAARDVFQRLAYNDWNQGVGTTWAEAFAESAELIDTIPAADVVEVKHGQWEICSDGYYPFCPACKSEPPGRVMTDYCPNCGARMDARRWTNL